MKQKKVFELAKLSSDKLKRIAELEEMLSREIGQKVALVVYVEGESTQDSPDNNGFLYWS